MGSVQFSYFLDFRILIFFSFLLFVIPFQAAEAVVSIVWDDVSYSISKGGPISGPENTFTVSDSDLIGGGQQTIDVLISSSTGSSTTLRLLESITDDGTFTNKNIVFTHGDAEFFITDTVTVSIEDPCVPDDGIGNCDPTLVETLVANIGAGNGAFAISNSDLFGIFFNLTETGPNTGVFTRSLSFCTNPGCSNSLTATLEVVPGDVISIGDEQTFAFVNGLIIPTILPASIGAVASEIDGTVTASYLTANKSVGIDGDGIPGRGSGGAIRPGLVVDSPASSGSSSGSSTHEPPTIGPNLAGTKQLVGQGGIKIDRKSFLVTKPFHQEFELYEMLTGSHTISNEIFCPRGVDSCNYISIGVVPYGGSIDAAIWWIELRKDLLENWEVKVYDDTGKIGEPVTFTTQEIDNYRLVTSLTVPFNNIDTPSLKLWVQVRDHYNGIRNFYFNEGVQFKDADAYPIIETSYEKPLKIEPLCLNENPNHRYSCSFEKVRERATKIAEQTFHEIMRNIN